MVKRTQQKVVEEVLAETQLYVLCGTDTIGRFVAELIQFAFFFSIGIGILIRKFILVTPDSSQRYWDLLLGVICLLWSLFVLFRAATSKIKDGSGLVLRADGLVLLPEDQSVLKWEKIRKISFLPWIVTISGVDGRKLFVSFLHRDFEQLFKFFSLLAADDRGSDAKAQKYSRELRDVLKALIWKQEYGSLSESERTKKFLRESGRG